MNKAWMIRNDGKAIPVKVHPYIFEGDLEPTYAFEWLYKNTKFQKVKDLILDFIYIWAIEYLEVEQDTIVSEIIDEFSTYSAEEFPISAEFIEEIGPKIIDRTVSDDSLEAIEKVLSDELDQEFLRARFGGAFNSDNLSSGEIVFRISSECFNWYNIIFDFISKNERNLRIKCVTIVRDTGLLDKSLKYYKTHDGRSFYNQLPLSEFYTESGNPVVEKKHLYFDMDYKNYIPKMIFESLNKGSCISELTSLPINRVRLKNRIAIFKRKEWSVLGKQ